MRALVAIVAMLVAGQAVAEEAPPVTTQMQQQSSPIRDVPLGSPYRTGDADGAVQVPLRDFMSERIDQLRSEMLSRIDNLSKNQQQIIDERDRQYSQRFGAQQEATSAALAAAKEAVIKAEEAANKRFDSVNEFRQTLADQQSLFVTKDATDARFKSVEEKIASVTDRLNAVIFSREGAANLWGYLVGILGVLLAIGSFIILSTRRQPPGT